MPDLSGCKHIPFLRLPYLLLCYLLGCLFICLSVYLLICLSFICLSFICLSVYLFPTLLLFIQLVPFYPTCSFLSSLFPRVPQKGTTLSLFLHLLFQACSFLYLKKEQPSLWLVPSRPTKRNKLCYYYTIIPWQHSSISRIVPDLWL